MTVDTLLYILDDAHQPVPIKDTLRWAKWFERDGNRRIQCTLVGHWGRNRAMVSTIFLGLNHRFSLKGPPILFETMIRGGPMHGQQWRCSTYEEALIQHEMAVAVARAARKYPNA